MGQKFFRYSCDQLCRALSITGTGGGSDDIVVERMICRPWWFPVRHACPHNAQFNATHPSSSRAEHDIIPDLCLVFSLWEGPRGSGVANVNLMQRRVPGH